MTEASGFAEARRHIDQAPPDVLITDVKLHAYNGLHLAIWLRNQGWSTPTVLIGPDDSVLQQEAARAQARYLVAPVSRTVLLESVRLAADVRPGAANRREHWHVASVPADRAGDTPVHLGSARPADAPTTTDQERRRPGESGPERLRRAGQFGSTTGANAMKPSVMITGGCGFIGSNLVKRLLETGDDQIVVVDKLTYANQLALETVLSDPRVRLVTADIADREAMAALFNEVRPAAVLNLAAETHVDHSVESAWAFVATNVNGTAVLLEEILRTLKSRSDVDRHGFRFLHVSTDEVFGSLGAEGLFTESTRYAPSSPYAASKAAADHFVRAFAATYGLPVLITHCSNAYGPFQHPEKLIPLIILNALDARPLPIYGDGGNVRDWLHVDDYCSALLAVLERGRVGESYNVGASNEQSNVQIVDRLCEVIEELVPARTNDAMRSAGIESYRDLRTFIADRPGHDRRYALDTTKLCTELGWQPRHTFVQGLRDTVQWYVANRRRLDFSHVGYDRHRLGLGTTTGSLSPIL